MCNLINTHTHTKKKTGCGGQGEISVSMNINCSINNVSCRARAPGSEPRVENRRGTGSGRGGWEIGEEAQETTQDL